MNKILWVKIQKQRQKVKNKKKTVNEGKKHLLEYLKKMFENVLQASRLFYLEKP